MKGIVSGCIRACTYSNAYSIFGRAISARPARSRRDRSRGSLFYARFLYSIQPRFLSPDEPDTRNTSRPDAPPSYPLKNSFSRASARRDCIPPATTCDSAYPLSSFLSSSGPSIRPACPCIHAAKQLSLCYRPPETEPFVEPRENPTRTRETKEGIRRRCIRLRCQAES